MAFIHGRAMAPECFCPGSTDGATALWERASAGRAAGVGRLCIEVSAKIRATKLAHFLVVYIRAVSVEKRNSVCTNRSQHLFIRHILYSCDLLFVEREKPLLVVLAFMSTSETAPHTNMCFRFA